MQLRRHLAVVMIVAEREVVDERGRPVRDTDQVEAEVEELRGRLAPRPVAGQIKTPDEIVNDLEWAKYLSSRTPVVIRDADRTLRALQRRYAREFSVLVRDSSAKSSDERKQETDAQLAGLVEAIDQAEVVLEYAKRVAKSVEASTSAIQTQAAQVRITFELAGSGRGHG